MSNVFSIIRLALLNLRQNINITIITIYDTITCNCKLFDHGPGGHWFDLEMALRVRCPGVR